MPLLFLGDIIFSGPIKISAHLLTPASWKTSPPLFHHSSFSFNKGQIGVHRRADFILEGDFEKVFNKWTNGTYRRYDKSQSGAYWTPRRSSIVQHHKETQCVYFHVFNLESKRDNIMNSLECLNWIQSIARNSETRSSHVLFQMLRNPNLGGCDVT